MDRTIGLWCFYLFLTWTTIEAGDATDASNRTLDGESLLDLGRRYNKPMLRLIGQSLMNLECQRHRCSYWSDWSTCKLFVGDYGVRSRTRMCRGTATSDCQTQAGMTTDTETDICQKFCPSGYEMVQNKFCLRFNNVSGQTYENAVDSCKAEGGYLVNINSREKWEAFTMLVERYPSATYSHIDGRRQDNNSPWEYSYESHITGYTNWGPGDPDNGSADLCMMAYKDTDWGLYDNDCSVKRSFTCEIVPM